jgi:hypothetical protein
MHPIFFGMLNTYYSWSCFHMDHIRERPCFLLQISKEREYVLISLQIIFQLEILEISCHLMYSSKPNNGSNSQNLISFYIIYSSIDLIKTQCGFALMSNISNVIEPVIFNEANKHEEWRNTMEEEYDTIMKNKTWELTELPKDKNLI